MTNNLGQLIQILQDNEIDFVVIGGFSAILHGSSMVTQDLDICIRFDEATLFKLRDIFKDLHPKHRMRPDKLSFLEYPTSFKHTKNIYLETDYGILDILGFVGGVGDFNEVKKDAVKIKVFDKPCSILSIDNLIKAKTYMGRPKDLMTIQELKCINQKK